MSFAGPANNGDRSAEERQTLAPIYGYAARSLSFGTRSQWSFCDFMTSSLGFRPSRLKVASLAAPFEMAGCFSRPSMGCGAPFVGLYPL